ncbi:MAG: SUF system NifU family Fe-S cluster assembly protein [Candidatus Micrarchaeaceae archaeon]
MELYGEIIIDNYENPRNKGSMENADAKFHELNTTCGDEITMYIKVKDGKIEDVKFEGKGCAISMATASMLTEAVKGKSIKDIEKLDFEFIKKLIGLDPGPARLKCATLSLKTLKGAVFIYEHKPMDEATKRL